MAVDVDYVLHLSSFGVLELDRNGVTLTDIVDQDGYPLSLKQRRQLVVVGFRWFREVDGDGLNLDGGAL